MRPQVTKGIREVLQYLDLAREPHQRYCTLLGSRRASEQPRHDGAKLECVQAEPCTERLVRLPFEPMCSQVAALRGLTGSRAKKVPRWEVSWS
jgi:hypothetical protein